MKATSSLPTEDRVKKMNDVQWIWYYLNIVKDDEELGNEDRNKMDYLTWFINPQLAEGVIKNKEKGISGKTRVNDGNTQHNDFFDDEFKRALAESGMSEDDFTELPSSDMAGDPNENEEDFMRRVEQQFNNELFNQSQNDDIDYFEYPENPEN